jgi:hypothetical protein
MGGLSGTTYPRLVFLGGGGRGWGASYLLLSFSWRKQRHFRTYNFDDQVLDALTGSCKKAQKEYVAGRMADKLHKWVPESLRQNVQLAEWQTNLTNVFLKV